MWFFDGLRNRVAKLLSTEGVKEGVNSPPVDETSLVYNDSTLKLNMRENFLLYERMEDESPEFAYALDFLADLATQGDDVLMRGHKVVVDQEESTEENKSKGDITYNVKILHDGTGSAAMNADKLEERIKAFEKRTKLKYNLRNMVRDALKYGDHISEVVYGEITDGPNKGQEVVANFYRLNVLNIRLNKDKYGRLDKVKPYSFIPEDKQDSGADYSKDEIFRLSFGGNFENEFGRGIAHSGRKTFIRLDSMESGMVIGRLVRSHQRYFIKVDVTGMTNDRALEHVDKVKNKYAKKKIADIYGNVKYLNNPLSAEEDIYYGVKKDSPADMKVLEGSPYLSYIDDVSYFLSKWMKSLKATKPAAGQSSGSRNAIAEFETDTIRYVKSMQNVIRAELERIYAAELKLWGIDPSNIEIEMPEISSVTEIRKWDIERARAEVIKIHTDAKSLSLPWMLENIMYLTEAEKQEVMDELAQQKEDDANAAMELMKAKTPEQPVDPNNKGGGSVRVKTAPFSNKKLAKKANSYVAAPKAEEGVQEHPKDIEEEKLESTEGIDENNNI